MDPTAPRGARQRLVLADHVYDELLASLIDGRFAPGDALNIDGLARELDVSQTPIREALARLEATGLVVRAALRGYRVAPPFSARDLAELSDARLVLEPVNAGLAATRFGDELREALERSIDDMVAAPKGASFSEFRAYWAADERFHALISAAADNQFLHAAYRALGGQVLRFRMFAGGGVTDAEHAIAEHREILLALASGDADGAEAAMRRHIEGVRSRSLSEQRDAATADDATAR